MSFFRRRLPTLIALLALTPATLAIADQTPGTETIVMVRHAEKPAEKARGQLDCQGLNRALALPSILARYGKPSAIFAANPTKPTDNDNSLPSATHHSYVRPLATIEPYAISLGMPVNAEIAATDIKGLEKELLKPEFANTLVVVAWEHIQARRFAEEMLKSFGQKDIVPRWLNSDYETIYIFRITTGPDKKRLLNFSVEREDLAKDLSDKCPVIAAPKPKETPPAVVPPGQTAPPSPDQQPQP
ncbi:MAG TPA: hypothetical protein VGU25_01780 [Acidobacteriaceae bacterium]|nr:hypothetical protein [Acidobacteriaceae bacterium]